MDKDLYEHLSVHGAKNNADLIHFTCFEWVTCLLVRQFNLDLVLRLFDTYITDEEGFQMFNTYVCATLFLKWAGKLKKLEFMELMVFL